VVLEPICYLFDIEEHVPIYNGSGRQVGLLSVELYAADEHGNKLSEIDNLEIDDPSLLEDQRLDVAICVKQALQLPDGLSSNVYTEFKFFNENEPIRTKRFFKRAVDPRWNFRKIFTFDPVTKDFLKYLQSESLVFKIVGAPSGDHSLPTSPTFENQDGKLEDGRDHGNAKAKKEKKRVAISPDSELALFNDSEEAHDATWLTKTAMPSITATSGFMNRRMSVAPNRRPSVSARRASTVPVRKKSVYDQSILNKQLLSGGESLLMASDGGAWSIEGLSLQQRRQSIHPSSPDMKLNLRKKSMAISSLEGGTVEGDFPSSPRTNRKKSVISSAEPINELLRSPIASRKKSVATSPFILPADPSNWSPTDIALAAASLSPSTPFRRSLIPTFSEAMDSPLSLLELPPSHDRKKSIAISIIEPSLADPSGKSMYLNMPDVSTPIRKKSLAPVDAMARKKSLAVIASLLETPSGRKKSIAYPAQQVSAAAAVISEILAEQKHAMQAHVEWMRTSRDLMKIEGSVDSNSLRAMLAEKVQALKEANRLLSSANPVSLPPVTPLSTGLSHSHGTHPPFTPLNHSNQNATRETTNSPTFKTPKGMLPTDIRQLAWQRRTNQALNNNSPTKPTTPSKHSPSGNAKRRIMPPAS